VLGVPSVRVFLQGELTLPDSTIRFVVRLDGGSQEVWYVPDVQDYLRLASEADDLAALLPDAELAASYHKLADSYQRLALFPRTAFGIPYRLGR
jgi:hypothetical protein